MNTQSTSPVYQFFFEKKTFSILVTLFLIATGIIAYRNMIKEANPDLEIPQALVYTEWPGASPELVEKEVTSKIEQKIKSIKGLKRYRSGSSSGVSVVSVEFHADSSMGESMQMLRTKVAEAEPYLPKSANKPYVEPILVGDFPIISFLVYGELGEKELGLAANRIRDRLVRIPGIKKVEIEGGSQQIVQIRLRSERLSALGISPYMVSERIKNENIDVPWGQFNNTEFNSFFELSGRFQDIEELKSLPIAGPGSDQPIYLKDIADVAILQGRETSKAFFSKNGEPFTKTIAISLYKLPGKDTIRLIKHAKGIIDDQRMGAVLPKGLEIDIISDESKLINSQLGTVFNNIWQAMAAVSIVLFIMLSWREALVASVAVPVTFLGAVSLLWAMGYTINELVITGMVISLGLLIDSFILMMEGMHDGIFIQKLTPRKAVAYTIKTYASPLLSGILTTVLVFVPLMTIGGIEGKFIRLIPVTAAICLGFSYFVAVFLATPLSQLILHFKTKTVKKTRVDRLNDRVSEKLSHWLKRYAISGKKRALAWVGVTVLMFLFSVYCAGLLPNQLYPKADGRKLGITIEFPSDTSLEQSEAYADNIGRILQKKHYFESITKYVGLKSPFSLNSMVEWLTETHGPHLAGFSCIFKEKEERSKLGYEYAAELRRELQSVVRQIPGSHLTMTAETGGSDSGDAIQIEIVGKDMSRLREISAEVQKILVQINGARDVRDNSGQTQRFVKFRPNRNALNFHQIDIGRMSMEMRLAMSSEKIGKLLLPGEQRYVDIWIGTGWSEKLNELGKPTSWENLSSIAIINNQGVRIPMEALITPQVVEAPPAISRRNSERAIMIMAKNSNRTVDEIMKELVPKLEDARKNWPPGYDFILSGEVEAAADTYGNMAQAFGIGLFMVFSVLALLFDSFKQPFIIMFSVLFALIGTFCGFFLFRIPISFPATFGIVSLIGIVVNDAIVMIDTMNTNLKNGCTLQESAASGAADRLRPILSTTITTSIGLVPLALSSPMWMPLCTAIIFGLVSATFFSLVLIPCLYLLLTPEPVITTAESA